jgi:hypothetical protein
MKIKIARYYVCRVCGRKAQTSLGFPADWLLVLVAKSDQWEVVCPDHYSHNNPAVSKTYTTNYTTGKYSDYKYPKGEEKKEE